MIKKWIAINEYYVAVFVGLAFASILLTCGSLLFRFRKKNVGNQ